MSESKMEALTSAAEVAGAVLIAVGFCLWFLPLGLIVGGGELVGLGWLLAPTARGRRV